MRSNTIGSFLFCHGNFRSARLSTSYVRIAYVRKVRIVPVWLTHDALNARVCGRLRKVIVVGCSSCLTLIYSAKLLGRTHRRCDTHGGQTVAGTCGVVVNDTTYSC